MLVFLIPNGTACRKLLPNALSKPGWGPPLEGGFSAHPFSCSETSFLCPHPGASSHSLPDPWHSCHPQSAFISQPRQVCAPGLSLQIHLSPFVFCLSPLLLALWSIIMTLSEHSQMPASDEVHTPFLWTHLPHLPSDTFAMLLGAMVHTCFNRRTG